MPTGIKIPENELPGEEIVRDYELRYRMMAENTALGMFLVTSGPEGRILSVNRVIGRMLGYDRPEDLVGKPASELFIWSREIGDLESDLVKEGSVVGREICLKLKDGSELWVSFQAWKLGTTDNGLMILEGFVEDITERRVSEQEMHFHDSELNRYALALAQANKKLNLLSSITRHDILNKLTGLGGYMELMKMDFSDPKLHEYLTIQEDILQVIVHQIQFTKDYQGIGVESPQWFNVKETILVATGGLTLPPGTLSVETGDLWIYADPMLEKVFYNLIENALRHGGNLTRIAFTTEVSNDTARIICEDNGCGVPEQFKEAIFVRRHFKNTGFGLFLSREILGITGLSILENGVPGKGARFVITVPRGYFRSGMQAGE
nr:PAS domain-containing sensor histidine kinase [uncultured Methanoregula sp.]